MKKFILLTTILALFNISYSQEDIKVLFLGNSYTYVNNLPVIIEELATGSNKTIYHESICPGGCTLFQHVENEASLSKIRNGNWDFVVLQEQSQLPSIDYYRHNAMKPAYQALYDTIMLYNPEAKVVGYMTWGRQYGGQQCVNFGEGLYCSADFADFNHMQDTMSVAYCECAYQTDSYVAPVGDAWKAALNSDPEIILHSSDQSHPSYDGSYLAACVFYAVLWNESPIGAYHNSQIDASKAEFLQTIADEVVFNNLDKWNIDNVNVNEIEIIDYDIISNPDSDSIIIKNPNGRSADVKILNINGVLITEKNIHTNDCININNASGIYLIQITDKELRNQYVKKIIKF